MSEEKIEAAMRAIEYDVPIRTLAVLLDVSKDVVARHKRHMHHPPPIRHRQPRSRRKLMQEILLEVGINPAFGDLI